MNVNLHRVMVALPVALILAASSIEASAIMFSLAPSTQTAATGDTVSVDLRVAGLGDFASLSLGDFDIDVSYDPLALTFTNYTLGPLLGVPLLGEAIDFGLGNLGSSVNLGEVSLLTPAELQALQPGSFVLAKLDFQVLSLEPGARTGLSLAVNSAGDEVGQALPVDGVAGALIRNPPIAAPEPPLLLLMGTALAGTGFARRRSPV